MKSERLEYKIKEDNYFEIYLEEKYIGFIYAHHVNKNDKSCEIGYYINEDYRNNGYATESLKTFINYLINKKDFNKVICECLTTNKASIKVIEKADMEFSGTLFEETKNYVGKTFIYSYFK